MSVRIVKQKFEARSYPEAPKDKSMNDTKNYISEIRKYTLLAICINISLTAIKFTVGIIGRSQSVVADACHSASDLSTDLLIMFGVRFWAVPADKKHPYGHTRIEAIVTALIGFVLAYVAFKISYRAVRTIGVTHGHPTPIATIGPILTIIIKSWLYKITISFGRRIKSSAVIGNSRHQLSDVVSSIPALIGSVVPSLFPELTIIDHLGAVIVTLFILQFAWSVTVPALFELTDTGITSEKRREIVRLMRSIPGVQVVQNIRSRKVGSGYFLDLTILLEADMPIKDGHDIVEQVKKILTQKDNSIIDVVVQVEPFFSKKFMYNCYQKMTLSMRSNDVSHPVENILTGS